MPTEFWGLSAFKTMLFTGPQPSRLQKQRYLPLRPAKDYGTPQKTIQSPDRQYEAPTDYTRPRQTIESPQKIIQTHKY